ARTSPAPPLLRASVCAPPLPPPPAAPRIPPPPLPRSTPPRRRARDDPRLRSVGLQDPDPGAWDIQRDCQSSLEARLLTGLPAAASSSGSRRPRALAGPPGHLVPVVLLRAEPCAHRSWPAAPACPCRSTSVCT